MSRHHLAQINIGRLVQPLDSPQLAGFVNALVPINALADSSPGFVWRLQTEAGDATSVRAFDDDRIIVNLSAWESPEALWNFVYVSRHLEIMRRRREFFERLSEVYTALWWIEAGTLPTVADAKRRLQILEARGPSGDAFTFKTMYPSPAVDSAASGSPSDAAPTRRWPRPASPGPLVHVIDRVDR